MKHFNYFLAVSLTALSLQTQANESEYIPLNYNSPGVETDAQETIQTKDADVVLNQYKDLDQDGVADKLDHCLNTIFGVKVDAKGCELDSDQDGVYDRLDHCPGTTPGVKVNVFGCEGDEDNDGVFDSKDQCPGTPEGTPVDEVGCKLILDTDKDGVNDTEDQCPNTPAGEAVNEHGCVPVNIVLTNIVFDSNKHDIRDDQVATIKQDAAALSTLKEGEVVLITGHTDWQAPQPFNLRLSWRRANSAKQFIVNELGHSADRVYITGKGELEPIADNNTEQGRQQNRRIEFKVIELDAVPADATQTMPVEMEKF